MKEITIHQLKQLPKEDYQLIDIRDEGSIRYGMIPDAVCIPAASFDGELDQCIEKLDQNRKIVLYCQRGEQSREIAEQLEERNLDAYSLSGGPHCCLYFKWKRFYAHGKTLSGVAKA